MKLILVSPSRSLLISLLTIISPLPPGSSLDASTLPHHHRKVDDSSLQHTNPHEHHDGHRHRHSHRRVQQQQEEGEITLTCDYVENEAFEEEFVKSYFNTSYYEDPKCIEIENPETGGSAGADTYPILNCDSDLSDVVARGTFGTLRNLCKDAAAEAVLYAIDWHVSCSDGSMFKETSHPFDCRINCGDGSAMANDITSNMSAKEWLDFLDDDDETDIECKFDKFVVRVF